ncbi:uncharacterized protein V6R79_008188 [Siganus canaliculatus]
MNNSSCLHNSEFTHRYLLSVYSSVLAVGLLANAWGFKCLMDKWQQLGNVNVFVLNLGLANVLYLLVLPFLVVYYSMESWIFGDTFCKITRLCFNMNLYGSIGFLTCISIYRYLAIVHPMRTLGRITLTHSVAISLVVWLSVSAQCLPDIFFDKHVDNRTSKCFDTTSDNRVQDYLKYDLGWTLIGFCIPLLIILGCYGHVIVVLCRTDTTDPELKKKSLRLLFVLILLFSVCYIPYHVLKNLNLWSRVLAKHGNCSKWNNGVYVAHRICRGLVVLNSALNPLVYLHGHREIAAHLRQLVQRAHQAVRQLFITT